MSKKHAEAIMHSGHDVDIDKMYIWANPNTFGEVQYSIVLLNGKMINGSFFVEQLARKNPHYPGQNFSGYKL